MWILLPSFFFARITENAVELASSGNIAVDGNSGIGGVDVGVGVGVAVGVEVGAREMKKQLAGFQTFVEFLRGVGVTDDMLIQLTLEKLHREQKEIPEGERPRGPIRIREETKIH